MVVLIISRLSRNYGTQEAIGDAKRAVYIIAMYTVEDGMTPETLSGLTAADTTVRNASRDEMDLLFERAARVGGLIRVKLWNESGNLIYADDRRLLDTGLRLESPEMKVLRGGGVEAEVSDLTKAENVFEQSNGRLLEVYLAVRGPNQEPLLFEAYLPYSRVTVSSRRLLMQFGPVMVAGLCVMQCIGTLLVWSTARRLRRAQQLRELLLQHAIDASNGERRRIAADLHDGIVQDLTGVMFAIAAKRRRGDTADPTDTTDPAGQKFSSKDSGDHSQSMEGQIRHAINALRSLIVDIYPPNLRSEGLDASVQSLCSKARNRGISTRVTARLNEQLLSDEHVALAYRVIQEALRNVYAHADAQHVEINLEQSPSLLRVSVDDDGNGFDPRTLRTRAEEGHVGLRGLGDLVREQAGSLHVRSRPGTGTSVVLTLPFFHAT
jgi:two-component system, NarL family, sensor kinase